MGYLEQSLARAGSRIQIDFAFSIEQELQVLLVLMDNCIVESSVFELVADSHVGALLDEQLHGIELACKDSDKECSVSAPVGMVDIGTVGEKAGNGVQSSTFGGME